MTEAAFSWSFCYRKTVIAPGRRGHAHALQFEFHTPSVSQRPVERAQWRGHFRRTEERIVSGDSPRLRALPGGQVAIGTYPVGLWMEPVAQMVLQIFRNCEFPKTGSWHFISVFFYFLNKFCTKCLVPSGQIEKIAVL